MVEVQQFYDYFKSDLHFQFYGVHFRTLFLLNRMIKNSKINIYSFFLKLMKIKSVIIKHERY